MSLLIDSKSQKPVRTIYQGNDGKRYEVAQPYMRRGTIFVNTMSEENGILSTMIFRMYPTDSSVPVTIDWGDGSLSSISVEEGQTYTPLVKHTYQKYGEYDVEIDNSISALNVWNGGYEYAPNYSYTSLTYQNKSITQIRRFGTNLKYLTAGCFSNCSRLSVWNIENCKVENFGSGASHKISPFGAFRGTSPQMSQLILNEHAVYVGGTVFGEMGSKVIEIDLSRCKDMKALGAYSFYSTPNIQSVKLPPISFNTTETSRTHYFRRCGRDARNGGVGPFYSVRFPEEMLNAPSEFFSDAYKLSSISVNKAFTKFSDTAFEGTSLSEIDFRERELSDIPSIYQIGRWGPSKTISCHFTDHEALLNVSHGDLSVLCDDGTLSLHFAQPRDLTASGIRQVASGSQNVYLACEGISSYPMYETKQMYYDYTGYDFNDSANYTRSIVQSTRGTYTSIPTLHLNPTDTIISSNGESVEVSAYQGTISARCCVEYYKDFFYREDTSHTSTLTSNIAQVLLYPYVAGAPVAKPSFAPSPSSFRDWTYTPQDLDYEPAEDE